ncbi:hypothetical protein [Alicyclobacillus tolerans]|uniref:Uncharacterized protein n=2 Tax=Alicyclobacillus tolerans TaxID=90970 RepID=A0ABT9LXR5_9BACL|nr:MULTISPECIES: hypothetical protein [Alicyclobacillus]MDP9729054.1 hypothetical protein [Alicyclobacillus tengchongensis]SHK89747.1 hypothetical protein SAMN05443507_12616 [Alicyclobacillus montanus]
MPKKWIIEEKFEGGESEDKVWNDCLLILLEYLRLDQAVEQSVPSSHDEPFYEGGVAVDSLRHLRSRIR